MAEISMCDACVSKTFTGTCQEAARSQQDERDYIMHKCKVCTLISIGKWISFCEEYGEPTCQPCARKYEDADFCDVCFPIQNAKYADSGEM